ncbi:MAG TPA: DNA gyrase inhibitor YacG [Sedimentisphaerales bacterium]|nr:DNA gyrase inhibitor YacG [Sedimentisphaerales bacterium]
MKSKCPICAKFVQYVATEPEQVRFFPFCSRRCKLIDLGAWLDSRYRIVSKSNPPHPAKAPDPSSNTLIEDQ